MVRNWGDGLEIASGRFLVFLADDDRLGPTFVESRLRVSRDLKPWLASRTMRFTLQTGDSSAWVVTRTRPRLSSVG